MARKSPIISNWPKYLLQWGVLAAVVISATGILPGEKAADPEAYCPMGGLQALATYFTKGSLPCSMSSLQIMAGIALAAAVIFFGKLFCGYLCPLGTLQDLLAKARRFFNIKDIRIENGSKADSLLRIIKYFLLFWIFYMTMTASELFCKNFDPYYAAATGFRGESVLWMSVAAIFVLVAGSFLINMFWCKYLCPLGAISGSLKFWLCLVIVFALFRLIGLTGVRIPWQITLGVFCLSGYLLEVLYRKPKLQLVDIIKEENVCTHCGLCNKHCPYGIDINALGEGRLNSVDCTLCGECRAVCPTSALHIGISRRNRSVLWKYVPALLTVLFVIAGIWSGQRFELPTIDETWGLEDETSDRTIGPENLETLRIDGLRSVKCYGSSMAFKARLQKIPGTHGVRTYVKSHYAIITYDPEAVSPEKIRESIYIPSKYRISAPDPDVVDSVKVITIRTEKMYDKLDLNQLGARIKLSGKKIYGIESEFACPLIVRIYSDPTECLDSEWFREIVETVVISEPGGATKETESGFRFVKMEDPAAFITTGSLLTSMFSQNKDE